MRQRSGHHRMAHTSAVENPISVKVENMLRRRGLTDATWLQLEAPSRAGTHNWLRSQR